MLSKISEFFKALFEKDNALKVISILLAVIIWAFVSITVYPTIEREVYTVPVKISLEDTYAQSVQLDVTSSSVKTVNIRIKGERAQIGDLKTEDLVAVADVSNVMMPKEYNLSMHIESSEDRSFEVISIEPSTISVAFDKIITKEFEVNPVFENLRVASGYMRGDSIVSPSTIKVTGPQDTINSITKLCARVTTDKELDSSYEFTTDDIVLYNNNAVIDNANQLITFDKTTVAVHVPVYVRQTLPLEVNIINAPENFDLEDFRSKLIFSANELNIAAPNDKIKELESLNIGTINMREVDVGSVFEFSTENFLPDGYENLSQIEKITVTCPSEGIAKKPIAIMGKDIQFVNKPAQFEFTPVASGMTLFLVGDENQIAELSSADITAQIDLIDFNMQEGDLKMPVDFIISSYDKVWFNGDDGIATPKIYVTAKLIETEEVSMD
ncbi:MAG: YbbR-like domain-containing protein [Huintestinicola sp.]